MVNQLNEEINEKITYLKIQQLKEEELTKQNNQLHKLVNKYRESKKADKISVGCQTEEVGITMIQLAICICIIILQYTHACGCIYVTRFAKRSLIHTSDFAIMMNYRLRYYIKNFTHISVMIGQSSYKILKLFLNHKLSYISLKLKN